MGLAALVVTQVEELRAEPVEPVAPGSALAEELECLPEETLVGLVAANPVAFLRPSRPCRLL